MTKRIERSQSNSCVDTASWLRLRWDVLRLAGLLVRPYSRPAPAATVFLDDVIRRNWRSALPAGCCTSAVMSMSPGQPVNPRFL